MEAIKFDRVVSVNSEIQSHNAQNLLNPEVSLQKSWLCEKGTDKAIVILQLERAALFSAIHIGNAHSAFIEVLVGRASDGADQFHSLIPMSTFMSLNDSKTGKNPNQVRFFNKKDFDQQSANKQWDRIKIVCSQPFNKHVSFGMCFIKILGDKESGSESTFPLFKEEEKIEIGSFFKKKKETTESTKQELSVTEQIREAEKPSNLAQHTPLSASRIKEKMTEKRKRKTKRKDEEEQSSDNRKNRDLGLEETTPTKKQKLSEKKETDGEKKKKKTAGKTEDERKRRRSSTETKMKKKPFNTLMEDVVFVISGFKNPLRGNIRSMAIQMGAKYAADWDSSCTHLICAYENTPKFDQVKGSGKIVKKDWIEKCHADKRRYPWRRYALDEDDKKQDESEEEIISENVSSKLKDDDISTSSRHEKEDGDKREKTMKQSSDNAEYEEMTDEEDDKREDTSNYPMPFLPDIFSMKTFYVDNNVTNRNKIERYIVAYNGIITEALNEDVDYYVTDKGGSLLDIFRKKAPNFVAVNPSWIWEINSKQKWIPTTQFLVK